MKKIWLIAVALWLLPNASQAQSFDPQLAARLQYTIDTIRANNNIKGISACIIYPGQGTWKGVTGISHPGTPINSEMEFGIASNTKLFTGVLLLQLAEDNIISLDDSLHEYLSLPNNNIDSNITIRQLLNNTSGLANAADVVGYGDSVLTDPYRIFTPEEVMNWVGPPMFAPGTSWAYCSTNYQLAGMIAESATGQSYGQLLHDRILTPLQLDSTFLDVYDSVLYTIAHPWQDGVNNSGIPRKALNSVTWAAGGMYSTSGEMAQWYHALMSGQVLGPAAMTEMTTFVGSGSYGVGLFRSTVLGRTVWQHGGNIWGGYKSAMVYDTASGIVICVLINQIPAQPFLVATQLLSLLLDNALGTVGIQPANEPVSVCPNPSNGLLTVRAPRQNIRNIQIFRPTGELLRSSREAEFSIADLPNGTYFVVVHTDSGSYVEKIVKQ
jgi:D-alanyl-D-alanine carboxypeptidase